MSIVYGIIKQNGGEVYVYSEPDRGTVFQIYLPQTTMVADHETRPAETKQTTGNECILLVEDDDQVRRLVRTMLVNKGYRVKDTADTEEAIYYAKQHEGQLDLLLSDVVMPQMNGPELADELKAYQPQMKVIFMSGYPGPGLSASLPEKADFLQKPFSTEDLLAQIRQSLDRQRVGR